MKRLVILLLMMALSSPSHAVEFGQDATGDANAVHIQGNTSGFLYSERIIFTAAHVLNQLRIQSNGDTTGFVYGPGVADKTNAKRYPIVRAYIPKTYVNADPNRGVQPLDDFAILVLGEDMPLKNKVVIASEEQMRNFARERAVIRMVGYGLQSGAQRSNPLLEKRAPHSLTGFLLTPEMMNDHYSRHQIRPPFWNKVEWGVNSSRSNGAPCSGDSGSGYFVEQGSVRYYVGTAGNGLGLSNCRADGSVEFDAGGAMSWFPAPHKFLNLLKDAESFVSGEKKKEEEARLAIEAKAKAEAELKAKLEAEARLKAEAELKAKLEAEARLKAEAEAKAKAEAEAKAKQELETRTDAETAMKAQQAAIARVAAEALTSKSILCIKGKTVKKISGVNSKCPTGYKQTKR